MTLLNSCHKFPDDPFISLRKPEKRLESKRWYLTKYYVNGIDSLNNHKPTPSVTNGWLSTQLVTFGSKANNGGTWQAFPSPDHGEYWSINGGNLVIDLNYGRYASQNDSTHLFPPVTTWKILELYRKTFKIAATYKNMYYEISFENK